jgi:hypothetical protein
LLSFDDEFIRDINGVGAYAFNGAINKNTVADRPTIFSFIAAINLVDCINNN